MIMLIKTLNVACASCLVASNVVAQDFDPTVFERKINEALASTPGVSVDLGDTPNFSGSALSALRESWASSVAADAPEFGFVVDDPEGIPVEILSGTAPFETIDGNISVTGYKLPTGYTIRTVGPAGWADATIEIAERTRVNAPSGDIGRVVSTISAAGDYIAQELCAQGARPTELVLNLTAGFELVFNLETGSQVTWDLEVVCERY
ncbi:hypothetical protein [Pseudooceanicola sp. 200-1SW]|uniref:hypothetical protein n=1 Tax=Pseudooceanicola sp. 200-1SW TaxID=3425949 RepID=UPI003D7F9F99